MSEALWIICVSWPKRDDRDYFSMTLKVLSYAKSAQSLRVVGSEPSCLLAQVSLRTREWVALPPPHLLAPSSQCVCVFLCHPPPPGVQNGRESPGPFLSWEQREDRTLAGLPMEPTVSEGGRPPQQDRNGRQPREWQRTWSRLKPRHDTLCRLRFQFQCSKAASFCMTFFFFLAPQDLN